MSAAGKTYLRHPEVRAADMLGSSTRDSNDDAPRDSLPPPEARLRASSTRYGGAEGGERRSIALGLLAALLFIAASLQPAAAQQQPYYKDKQIRLIAGSAPGGGYDTYARLVAAHLKRHIPGNPNIIVQNMPGAGSLVAANHLYNVAPRDGTVFAGVNSLVATQPLLLPERAKFDAQHFRWIGSALREYHTGIAWHTSPVQAFADLFQHELLVAGSGGSTNLYPVFIAGLLGAKLKMIPGYQGTRNGMLAMERGEVAGNFGISWASLKATQASWITDNKVRLLVQVARGRHPELPNVPLIYDFARNDADRAAMDLVFASQDFGRPYLTPPGVPEPVVAVLRAAFEATMNDPEFIADAERRKIDIEFTSGAEIQSLVERLYTIPRPVIDQVRTITERTAQ